MRVYQIDCFRIHLIFFKYLSIWCSKENQFPCYSIYVKAFIFIFIALFVFLATVNFFYIERHLDLFIEGLILWLTLVNVISKLLTFVMGREDIELILKTLETDVFQPKTEVGKSILKKAKDMNVRIWKMFTAVSLTSHLAHAGSPVLLHLALGLDLPLPVCSYSFLSEQILDRWLYPLYLYQWIGIQIYLWYNVNIDSFFLGLLNLLIAQLDILDHDLGTITDVPRTSVESDEDLENIYYSRLRDCVLHYISISKFCKLVQDTFSATLFTQFNIASYVICVCLYRLAMPLTPEYLVFLVMYLLVMVLQILVPCWFGHQIYDKSSQLPAAAYRSAWPLRPRRFTAALRVLVERARRPLAVVAGKIFPLLLTTFTSIANSAYSFYTLLRNVQAPPA